MSTDQSPKKPASGRSKPKETAAPAGPKPQAGKAPQGAQEGADRRGAEAERDAEAGPEKKRPDPTRYGDWEKNGRCIDF